MIVSELKVGELYVQPWNRKHKLIWFEPDNFKIHIVGKLQPTQPFVLLEFLNDHTFWTKILTHDGIVGWVEWDIEQFIKEDSFTEARA